MEFQSRGLRALVALHEKEIGAFHEVWLRAKEKGVRLPKTEDPDYESLDHLCRHLLRASRGYLTWIHEVLGRPDPEIPAVPEVDHVAAEAESYLGMLQDRWRRQLVWLTQEVLDAPTVYKTRWNQPITIESMLEHAVVHPMRHRLQLEELLGS